MSAWIEIVWIRLSCSWSCGRTLCECVDWNFSMNKEQNTIICRTLCECVDWNISWQLGNAIGNASHSLWVRGLKSYNLRCLFVDNRSHSLWVRGLKFIKPVVRRINNLVALLVSAWIEIRLLNHNRYGQRGRTPCECVDWNNKYDAMYYNDLSRTPCECVDWNMCVLQRKQKD